MVLIVGMSIWILALVLLLFSALLGHKQGAIRAAISFVGIVISALIAWPLAGPVGHLLKFVVKNEIAAWALAPVVAFIILLAIFKSVGLLIHRKARVFYQYNRDDVLLTRWLRLNARLGAGVGLLNGLVYLVLISVLIYNFSYWTLQIDSSDEAKFPVRWVNRLGQDLQETGLAKAAVAIDPLSDKYFKEADLAGLIYQNPQLANRLAAYPPFLPLAQRDDFRQFAGDADFRNSWQTHAPFGQIWSNPQFQSLWKNQDTKDLVENLVESNLDDLTSYLHTGQSQYDNEPILGSWDFNVVASLQAAIQNRVNVPSSEMLAMRTLWNQAYAKTVFVAAPDGEAFLNNFPQFSSSTNQPAFTALTLHGNWTTASPYDVTLSSDSVSKSGPVTVEGTQLHFRAGKETMIFDREQE